MKYRKALAQFFDKYPLLRRLMFFILWGSFGFAIANGEIELNWRTGLLALILLLITAGTLILEFEQTHD